MGEADVSKLERPKAGIPNCKPANHSLIVAPLYGRFSVLYRICDVLMEHAQRALRLPIGINLSKHKLLIFYLFLLATLHECNFLAILGCP